MKEEVKRRFDLLAKSVWTLKDIQEYLGVSKSKAFKIKNKLESVPYSASVVRIDDVLALFGTSRKAELETLKGLEEDEKNL